MNTAILSAVVLILAVGVPAAVVAVIRHIVRQADPGKRAAARPGPDAEDQAAEAAHDAAWEAEFGRARRPRPAGQHPYPLPDPGDLETNVLASLPELPEGTSGHYPYPWVSPYGLNLPDPVLRVLAGLPVLPEDAPSPETCSVATGEAAEPHAPGNLAQVRAGVLAGEDSHVRTGETAPGWPGAVLQGLPGHQPQDIPSPTTPVRAGVLAPLPERSLTLTSPGRAPGDVPAAGVWTPAVHRFTPDLDDDAGSSPAMCARCAAGYCGTASCHPGDCGCPCSTWASENSSGPAMVPGEMPGQAPGGPVETAGPEDQVDDRQMPGFMRAPSPGPAASRCDETLADLPFTAEDVELYGRTRAALDRAARLLAPTELAGLLLTAPLDQVAAIAYTGGAG